jgi:predicted metal-dependent hydrolase
MTSTVAYGDTRIAYRFIEQNGLKSHYISVEKGEGVTLKGRLIPTEEADKLILKKAKWIVDKLRLVAEKPNDDLIVSGSRLPYLGRNFYVEIIKDEAITKASVVFNYSKFKITINPNLVDVQGDIQRALTIFYRQKAIEKITRRVQYWSKRTGLKYNDLKFRSLEKRWGSCTPTDNIIINYEVVKLAYPLIDYIIVHELCHTKIKNHSKAFWQELASHLPEWKRLDALMFDMKL